jgi:hypothetical protein
VPIDGALPERRTPVLGLEHPQTTAKTTNEPVQMSHAAHEATVDGRPTALERPAPAKAAGAAWRPAGVGRAKYRLLSIPPYLVEQLPRLLAEATPAA